MVCLYGTSPYKVVLVHGGPGAIGSLKGFAKELSELSQIGVVEAIQSKYSIAELIEELYSQIKDNCANKVSLIGHSWGTWLVALFAEKYPELIEHVILVGSGPLEDKYVSEIGSRRFQNLSDEDSAIFQRLIKNQANYKEELPMSNKSRQKLIIITGSPCVGKTTVTDCLFQSYENSAFFDGDWAWCVNPFSVEDPRLRNGDKTMSFALSTYLNSDFDYVFFSSVVAVDKSIREAILNDITAKDYTVIGFTLTCTEKTLLERHKKRGDQNECSFFWLHLEPHPGDYVIHTDNKDVQQIVDEMKQIIDAEGE